MKIRWKKMHPAAVAPIHGTEYAAGFDLTATSREWNEDYNCWEYGTGVAVEIPPGYVGLVFSRSSVFRTGIILSNGAGVIDSDYRGEIKAKFYDILGGKPYEIGDRCIQLVIVPVANVEYEEVSELSETKRGTGGYGSTGR